MIHLCHVINEEKDTLSITISIPPLCEQPNGSIPSDSTCSICPASLGCVAKPEAVKDTRAAKTNGTLKRHCIVSPAPSCCAAPKLENSLSQPQRAHVLKAKCSSKPSAFGYLPTVSKEHGKTCRWHWVELVQYGSIFLLKIHSFICFLTKCSTAGVLSGPLMVRRFLAPLLLSAWYGVFRASEMGPVFLLGHIVSEKRLITIVTFASRRTCSKPGTIFTLWSVLWFLLLLDIPATTSLGKSTHDFLADIV